MQDGEADRQLSKQQQFKQQVMKHCHFHCSPQSGREVEELELEMEEEKEEEETS